MSYDILKDLQPQCFFKWFGAICEIPHHSRDEGAIMDFFKKFADERGYEWTQDEALNVFMKVPATPGYEDQPAVLFQAHADMVWAKEEDLDFDFESGPLKLKIEGGRLTASGTTLGADNGVGVATMLALADGQDIPHPPLELLFTSAEEVGLVGIRHFDMSKISARRMINMDCGDTDMFCVSSAGSIKSEISRTFETLPIPDGWCSLQITVDGGKGGHSGLRIGEERMCAVNTVAAVLDDVTCPKMLGKLGSYSGPIIKKADAIVAVPAQFKEKAMAEMEESFGLVKTMYAAEDPDVFMTVDDACCEKFVSEEDTESIVSLLSIYHTGAYRRNGAEPEIVVTSAALARTKLEDGQFYTLYTIRSANDKCGEIFHRCKAKIAEKYGFKLVVLDKYSGWPESPVSAFRDVFIDAYKARIGEAPKLERVHGGIEVGHIVGAIPDMDAVGYAPTSRGAHTPQEYLEISLVQPYWDVLTDVMARK